MTTKQKLEEKFEKEIYEELLEYGWDAFIALVKQFLFDSIVEVVEGLLSESEVDTSLDYCACGGVKLVKKLQAIKKEMGG